MRYVTREGTLYKMTRGSYRKFLQQGALGVGPDPDDHGKKLGPVLEVTVMWGAEDYRRVLEAELGLYEPTKDEL